ncbi:MAG TPA: hypothetical protein VH590_14985 [Ktedonobacterales bacterium]|jgi:hypothetical protein
MLDLDAPLVPGQSAAGYRIGMSIEEIPQRERALFQPTPILDYRGQPTGGIRYRSLNVDLWTDNAGHINQIGIHNGYRGKLLDKIHLGMTADDIERLIGPCAEDDEDTLTIRGIRGFCFEVPWQPKRSIPEDFDFTWPELRFAPIDWMFVFLIDWRIRDPWGSIVLARIPVYKRTNE